MSTGRWIGIVYLLYFATSGLGAWLGGRVLVAGDPGAWAGNMLAHEATYRAGYAFGLIGNATYVALTILFYGLFRPVHRTLALLMASFSLIGCTTQIVAGILQLAPLVILHESRLAGLFTIDQLRAAATVSLKIWSHTYDISFVLFGLFDFVLGLLIVRSTLLPRSLGVAMMIAGVVATTFLYPPLALALKWFVLPVAGAAEGVLMLWLLIRGVKVRA